MPSAGADEPSEDDGMTEKKPNVAPPAIDAAHLVPVVTALASTMALKVEDEWLQGIAQQLAISFSMAAKLDAVPLPDDAEPAPVYRL
jgi:hypothetical protein